MRLIVGYQATPSGADGIALGATLARSLQASLDICLVLPQERPVPSKAPVEAGYDDILIDRATGWLDEALTLVPEDVQARATCCSTSPSLRACSTPSESSTRT